MIKNNISDNTEINIDVYTSKIYELVDEYTGTLDDIELIHKVKVFNCMLIFINENIPKISNDNIELLDNVFSIFRKLCMKYDINPSLSLFSDLVGINVNTFSAWRSGEYRVGSSHSLTIQKWYDTCKQDLVNDLQNSNGASVNKIFTAKAAYGMIETTQQIHVTDNSHGNKSPDQIATEYKAPTLLPDLEDI